MGPGEGPLCQFSAEWHTCGNLYPLWFFIIFKLVHVVAYPFIIQSIKICILFTIGKIFHQTSIVPRRTILTTLRIIIRTILRCFTIMIKWCIGPTTTHITTINQFSNFLSDVVMNFQNTTQPIGITIPVMIDRKNRTVSKFKTNAGTGCHGVVSGERMKYGRNRGILQPPGGQFRNRPLRLPAWSKDHRSLRWREEHWSEYTPDPCRIHQQVL